MSTIQPNTGNTNFDQLSCYNDLKKKTKEGTEINGKPVKGIGLSDNGNLLMIKQKVGGFLGFGRTTVQTVVDVSGMELNAKNELKNKIAKTISGTHFGNSKNRREGIEEITQDKKLKNKSITIEYKTSKEKSQKQNMLQEELQNMYQEQQNIEKSEEIINKLNEEFAKTNNLSPEEVKEEFSIDAIQNHLLSVSALRKEFIDTPVHSRDARAVEQNLVIKSSLLALGARDGSSEIVEQFEDFFKNHPQKEFSFSACLERLEDFKKPSEAVPTPDLKLIKKAEDMVLRSMTPKDKEQALIDLQKAIVAQNARSDNSDTKNQKLNAPRYAVMAMVLEPMTLEERKQMLASLQNNLQKQIKQIEDTKNDPKISDDEKAERQKQKEAIPAVIEIVNKSIESGKKEQELIGFQQRIEETNQNSQISSEKREKQNVPIYAKMNNLIESMAEVSPQMLLVGVSNPDIKEAIKIIHGNKNDDNTFFSELRDATGEKLRKLQNNPYISEEVKNEIQEKMQTGNELLKQLDQASQITWPIKPEAIIEGYKDKKFDGDLLRSLINDPTILSNEQKASLFKAFAAAGELNPQKQLEALEQFKEFLQNSKEFELEKSAILESLDSLEKEKTDQNKTAINSAIDMVIDSMTLNEIISALRYGNFNFKYANVPGKLLEQLEISKKSSEAIPGPDLDLIKNVEKKVLQSIVAEGKARLLVKLKEKIEETNKNSQISEEERQKLNEPRIIIMDKVLASMTHEGKRLALIFLQGQINSEKEQKLNEPRYAVMKSMIESIPFKEKEQMLIYFQQQIETTKNSKISEEAKQDRNAPRYEVMNRVLESMAEVPPALVDNVSNQEIKEALKIIHGNKNDDNTFFSGLNTPAGFSKLQNNPYISEKVKNEIQEKMGKGDELLKQLNKAYPEIVWPIKPEAIIEGYKGEKIGNDLLGKLINDPTILSKEQKVSLFKAFAAAGELNPQKQLEALEQFKEFLQNSKEFEQEKSKILQSLEKEKQQIKIK
jgi:hypothetical protein